MGYSYVYLGDAQIPPDRLQAWLDAPANPSLFTGWPKDWGLASAPLELSVADVLDVLRSSEIARVEHEGGDIVVRVLADKGTDAWLTHRANLAAAFRQLAELGGRGRLVVTGFDDAPFNGGFVVDAAPGSSSCTDLGEAGAVAMLDHPAYAEVRALAESFVSAMLEKVGGFNPFELPASAPKRKPAPGKTASNNLAAKRPSANKPAAKKAAARKPATKKAATKKAATKKAAMKKPDAKKKPARKKQRR